MRSFYSHLQATRSIGEDIASTQKPTFRSSAIFPVLHNESYSTKILFMGYWLLKRNITEIGLLYTLRDDIGQILARKYVLVDSAKAFSIEMNEFAELLKVDFVGSLELEIFSTRDLVFPYPAFVLVYYNDHFSTAVHTIGRIYNDIEDLSQNEQYKVRESGFDIYGTSHLTPFIALTNGPIANKEPIVKYEIVNSKSESFKGEFLLSELKPFATTFIKLRDYINIDEMLGSEPGTIKIGHNFQGFFPRFVAGNFDKATDSISITHSYYDSSELSNTEAYWNRKNDFFEDSTVAIPLYISKGYYTKLAVYPIFSPSDFSLSFSFYDSEGNLLKSLRNYHPVRSKDNKYEQIDFEEIVRKENIDSDKAKSVKIICNWEDKDKIPTRVKFGLNIGSYSDKQQLPSNICFAPQLANPKVLDKSGTFHWGPFINIGKSEIALTNSSFLKEYDRPANLRLSFHRESDGESLNRQLTIPANGIRFINLDQDDELRIFFDGGSGWLAAQADNPFMNGYYFDFFENGAVAADHLF